MKATRRMLPPLLLAAFCWPLTEGAGGLLMRHHGAFQTVFLRYAAHLVVLVPIALTMRGRTAFQTSRPTLQLLRGFCMFVMPACFVAAMRFTDAGTFWTMFWGLPLLLLACARLIGERPGARLWGVTVLGCVLAMLATPGMAAQPLATLLSDAAALFGHPPALLLLLGTTGSFAAYLALSRTLRTERLSASLFYTALGAIAPMALLAAMTWTPIVADDLVPAFLIGVFSILLLTGFDLALEAATLSLVAPAIALIPLVEVALIAMLSEGR